MKYVLSFLHRPEMNPYYFEIKDLSKIFDVYDFLKTELNKIDILNLKAGHRFSNIHVAELLLETDQDFSDSIRDKLLKDYLVEVKEYTEF